MSPYSIENNALSEIDDLSSLNRTRRYKGLACMFSVIDWGKHAAKKQTVQRQSWRFGGDSLVKKRRRIDDTNCALMTGLQ